MAEEKKKIDLKARLGKGAPTPTPPPAGTSAPAAVPSAPGAPPPGISGPGLPVPPGVPVGPAPFDPTNPLAAVAAARPMSVAAPAQSQRIEVDEMAVQQAAGRARKTGFIIAFIALLLGIGAGFVGGQAKEAGDGRTQARGDAADLKKSVDAAKLKIDDMATKLEAGEKLLADKTQKQFPKDLANQLGGINVDFSGELLAGRRFSGFSKDTSKLLFDFVTSVSALNDHKTAIKNLLTKLEKPITEQFAASASGAHSIQYVALFGGTSGKDSAGNFTGNLAALNPPLSFTGDAPTLPPDIKANFSGQNVSVPKYKGGNLNDPSAVYITPGSFEAVCPSDTKSVVAQLGIKLHDLIMEIRGEGKPVGEIVQDVKLGIDEQADLLSKGLEKTAAGTK